MIETARAYRSAQSQLEEAEALIADPATDCEMRGMAEQERADCARNGWTRWITT